MTEEQDFNCQTEGKPCQRWCGAEPCALEGTPYPWCHGSPTKQDCIERGYCNRDPNCGE